MPNKRPISLEDLTKIKVISEPELSPCGSKVVFVQTMIDEDEEYQSHLFVQSLPDGKPIQWTFGKVRDHSPSWSPDGKTIAFVSNRSGNNQIWLIKVEGGEAQQLTNSRRGVSKPVWSPDSKKILFQITIKQGETIYDEVATEANEKKKSEPIVIERLKYKSDTLGFHNESYQHLGIIDIETKTITPLTTGPFNHEPGSWSPNGKAISFSANRHDDPDYHYLSDIYIYYVETEEISLLTDQKGVYHSPNWSPDGISLSCIGHELEYFGATINQIYLIDVYTKRKTCITSTWDVHIGDAAISDLRSGHPNPGAIWSSDGKKLYFLASENGNTGLYSINEENEISAIFQQDRHLFGFSLHKNTEMAVVAISDPSNPGDLYHIDVNKKSKKRLTYVNDQLLASRHLSLPEPITVTAKDGWDLHGWLMRPIGFEEGKQYPMILEIHGGPHAMYANTFFHELQLLAAQGYVVLYLNPRGSHGYGQRFVDACRGDYGGKDYEDLMTAVDYVIQTYDFIDEKRLGVIGGSYGGFMTNWIIGHTNRFKAAITLRSISNWTSFYGVSDIGSFFTKWEIGTCFQEDPEKLWYHSPLRYVKNVETPLLIMHGENDYRCPIEQAEQLYTALKHQKKDTKFIRFPESNHELSRSGPPHLRLERLNHIVHWFAEKL